MSIWYFIKLIRNVNPWKTIYFNFHYFPFKIAIKTPVYIYWRTELKGLGGRILLPQQIWRGMLHFGKYQVGIQDSFYLRSIFDLSGTLRLSGEAILGRGTRISVAEDATLTLGKNLVITGNTEIICYKGITFGENDLLSWDILIMDTDFHKIYDANNVHVNIPRPIVIGNHVWIGCRTTILKGVAISDNNVIASGSIVTKSFESENCVIGGMGSSAGVKKRDIYWEG